MNGSYMGTDAMMLGLWAGALDVIAAPGEEVIASWVVSALDQPDRLARIVSSSREGIEVVSLGNRCGPLQKG